MIQHTQGTDLWVRPDEACVALTSEFRLLQRIKGHRYSVDDLLVAHLACTLALSPRRVLDLGCGVGSVLLMVAWAMPDAQFVGIEAQSESLAMAKRNAFLNDCATRVALRLGDLREPAMIPDEGTFDLVTGTPPYFDPNAATLCSDSQRAHARFEIRGGIEAYAHAASRALTDNGVFVVCAPSLPPQRTKLALQEAQLNVIQHQAVLPRTDRPAFIDLIVCTKGSVDSAAFLPDLVLREVDGRRTKQHIEIRSWFGVPTSDR